MGNWYDGLNPITAAKGLGEGFKKLGGKIGGGLEDTWNSLSGKNGYDHLAAGAYDVSQQGKQFSQDQWNRQMEGLDKAQGAFAPSQNQWWATYGSDQGPGTFEDWYKQNGSSFGNVPNQQDTYSQFKGWASDPANNSTQHGATMGNQYIGGSTASSDAYGKYANQNYVNPTTGQSQYETNYRGLNTSGNAENYYNSTKGDYSAPLNSQTFLAQANGQLTNPGRSETFQVNAPTNLQSANAGAQAFATGPTRGMTGEAENKGYIRNASQAPDYYSSQLSQLSGPGQYENFVTQDINGDNPQLRMARDEASAALNLDLARRGHFDSGGAGVALGKLHGTFQAQDYQNRAQRAKDAQAMQLSRIGTGGQLSQGASNTSISQGQALQGIDSSNEAAQLSRQQFGLQYGQAASGEAMDGQRLALQAAGQGDQAALSRLQGLGAMNTNADQMRLQQLQQGQQAANTADQVALERYRQSQAAANGQDSTKLAANQQNMNLNAQNFDMAQGSDAANLARAQQLFAQGQGIDASDMDRFKMMNDQAQGLDQFNLASLLGQGGMAQGAQASEEQRKKALFESLFGLNNAQAGQVGNFYGTGGELSGSTMSDSLNALMQMYGNQAEGKNAGNELLGQIIGQLYKNGGTGMKLMSGGG